jgi:hypothetical protein
LDAPLELRSPEETFSIGDRVQLDGALGRLLADNPDLNVYDLDVDDLIEEELASDVGSMRSRRAREHVEKVLGKDQDDGEYRLKIIDFNKIEPVKPIAKEEPKATKDYHSDELIPWLLRQGDEWADKIPHYVEQLQKGNEDIRFLIADMKRKEDEAFYRRLESIYQLQDSKNGRPGVLNLIARSLVASIGTQLSSKEAIGILYASINTAAAIIAGVPKNQRNKATSNNGSLNTPAWHHMFLRPVIKNRIKEVAVTLLMQNGVLSDAARTYKTELGEMEREDDNDGE